MKTVYLVIPCYNEEEVLFETAKRLKEKLNNLIDDKIISAKSRITFIDDGSKDNVIDKFIERFNDGCDVVYGVRSERKTDTIFKRTTAQGFYKVMKALGVDIVYNHADYRLMSKRALEALSDFKEVNLFLRGIVPLIGYKSDVVLYERNERFAGESKYPLKKMLSFALEGITSFSVKPIRLILIVGIIMFISSLIALLYFLILWIIGKTIQGWTTVVTSIWMLGGIQLLCLGVIGEYIGKIYIESKARPKFIIDKFINS